MRAREREIESRRDTFSLTATCSSVHVPVHYYETSTLPGQSGLESYLHLSAAERLTVVGWQNNLASVLENQDFQNHVCPHKLYRPSFQTHNANSAKHGSGYLSYLACTFEFLTFSCSRCSMSTCAVQSWQ